MGIEIRNAVPDDYAAAAEVISTAFLERPDIRAVAAELEQSWEPERTWIAFDGARACGTFRSGPTELTVPGGARLPAAAVAAVTVLPTYRRRGILTGMAAKAHAGMRERGDAMGLLYASEYPIYGRFGYGPGTRWADWTIDTRAAGAGAVAVAGTATATGSIEVLTPDHEAMRTVMAVFEAWRPRQAGEIRRRERGWEVRLGLAEEPWGERWKGWLLLHRDGAGVVDGYARYKADAKWEHGAPAGELEVTELVALTEAAYADLVRYLLEIDLVRTVKLAGRRETERVRWLLRNARAARVTAGGDGVWVRLVDVPAALEARSYERAGRLVLEVVDDAAWSSTRRYLLDASPEGVTCHPTDAAPDLTLPVAALGGAYLGGTRLRDLVVATGADEHRQGALAEADALLRTSDEPWCSTFF
jgi:predicted acetyltransferase